MKELEAKEHSKSDKVPWQLEQFRYSLKKQKKLQALKPMLRAASGQTCLLITCGDNNGALNWHLRQSGGEWRWAEVEPERIVQISDLMGEPVVQIDKLAPALPFQPDTFDLIVVIDVHEHLPEPGLLNKELERVIKPGGKVIVTTPGADESKLANRIKNMLGMRPNDYGHLVPGYSIESLRQQLQAVGMESYAQASYSRFFTEFMELLLNFGYVRVLSAIKGENLESGQVAPKNEDDLKSMGKTYRIYSFLFPIIRAVSALDVLDRSKTGYAVIVAAEKAN